MSKDPSIMARNLALHHIASSVDQGLTEEYISSTWHASGRSHKHWHDAEDGFGGYQVSIGGYYDLDTSTGLMRKRVPTTKILVTEVCGIKGVWIFSLHELYEECRKGQTSLL